MDIFVCICMDPNNINLLFDKLFDEDEGMPAQHHNKPILPPIYKSNTQLNTLQQKYAKN